MIGSESKKRFKALVQLEVALFAAATVTFGRTTKLVLEGELACAERLLALTLEEKPVFPDSYERAAADVLALWRQTARQLAALPRLASMQYYARLAEYRGLKPQEVDPRGKSW